MEDQQQQQIEQKNDKEINLQNNNDIYNENQPIKIDQDQNNQIQSKQSILENEQNTEIIQNKSKGDSQNIFDNQQKVKKINDNDTSQIDKISSDNGIQENTYNEQKVDTDSDQKRNILENQQEQFQLQGESNKNQQEENLQQENLNFEDNGNDSNQTQDNEKQNENEQKVITDQTKILNQISEKLPTKKASKDKRKQIFKQFDQNGNGYLSLAELDKGVRDILQLEEIFNSKQVIMRAYQAARQLRKDGNNKEGVNEDGYVEFYEFRSFLIYLEQFFEYYLMFQVTDKDQDKRIDFEEFKQGINILQKYGAEIEQSNIEAEFQSIDVNGGGFILFDEFCQWAIKKNLDITIENDSEDEQEIKQNLTQSQVQINIEPKDQNDYQEQDVNNKEGEQKSQNNAQQQDQQVQQQQQEENEQQQEINLQDQQMKQQQDETEQQIQNDQQDQQEQKVQQQQSENQLQSQQNLQDQDQKLLQEQKEQTEQNQQGTLQDQDQQVQIQKDQNEQNSNQNMSDQDQQIQQQQEGAQLEQKKENKQQDKNQTQLLNGNANEEIKNKQQEDSIKQNQKNKQKQHSKQLISRKEDKAKTVQQKEAPSQELQIQKGKNIRKQTVNRQKQSQKIESKNLNQQNQKQSQNQEPESSSKVVERKKIKFQLGQQSSQSIDAKRQNIVKKRSTLNIDTELIHQRFEKNLQQILQNTVNQILVLSKNTFKKLSSEEKRLTKETLNILNKQIKEVETFKNDQISNKLQIKSQNIQQLSKQQFLAKLKEIFMNYVKMSFTLQSLEKNSIKKHEFMVFCKDFKISKKIKTDKLQKIFNQNQDKNEMNLEQFRQSLQQIMIQIKMQDNEQLIQSNDSFLNELENAVKTNEIILISQLLDLNDSIKYLENLGKPKFISEKKAIPFVNVKNQNLVKDSKVSKSLQSPRSMQIKEFQQLLQSFDNQEDELQQNQNSKNIEQIQQNQNQQNPIKPINNNELFLDSIQQQQDFIKRQNQNLMLYQNNSNANNENQKILIPYLNQHQLQQLQQQQQFMQQQQVNNNNLNGIIPNIPINESVLQQQPLDNTNNNNNIQMNNYENFQSPIINKSVLKVKQNSKNPTSNFQNKSLSPKANKNQKKFIYKNGQNSDRSLDSLQKKNNANQLSSNSYQQQIQNLQKQKHLLQIQQEQQQQKQQQIFQYQQFQQQNQMQINQSNNQPANVNPYSNNPQHPFSQINQSYIQRALEIEKQQNQKEIQVLTNIGYGSNNNKNNNNSLNKNILANQKENNGKVINKNKVSARYQQY